MRAKAIFAWCLYDWGISAFPVIVTTFVFAAYFTSKISPNEIIGTHQWGNASALAGIITAIFSPIFGAIADYSGGRKYWLGTFTLLVVITSALLWFAYPSTNYIYLTLTLVVLGTIGVNLSMVFYNALLTSIAPSEYVGRISGWGWGLGYLGGLAALIVALYGFIQAKPHWLDTTTLAQVRICGPLVAFWTAFFGCLLFLWVPDIIKKSYPIRAAISLGLTTLKNTLKSLPREKNILFFLIAQMIYIDGLNTLFAFGGIYAAGTFHMDITQVLLLGITLNIFAGIGSILLAWLDDIWGPKFIIYLSLLFLIFFGVCLVLVENQTKFWIFAALLSLFIGSVQSSSRSLMTRIIPKEKTTEMFGLYIFSGKATNFIGPWVLGSLTFLFNSQRVGIASILIFFIIGGIILLWVREPALE